MPVEYKYNFIELYSISGGSIKYDPGLRGIHINGSRPADALISRDFTLYQFGPTGKVISTKHYDLYASSQAGNTTGQDRMAADLDAMPVGQVFGIVTYDEPSKGHLLNPEGAWHIDLVNAFLRIGADATLYTKTWRPWSAYMLVGKVGDRAFFESLDETPRPDTAPTYGNGGIHLSFSVINNKIHAGKYQNSWLGKLLDTWKEGRSYFYKKQGKWYAIRKFYVKVNGIWMKRYTRNALYVVASGLNENKYPLEYSGISVNNVGGMQPSRSYNLALFDRNGEMGVTHSYDLHGDYLKSTTGEGDRMAIDLNALPAGQLFVLYSFDEPARNHLQPNALAAVLRVGGTNTVYGQPMAYRGAYLLIGKVGKNAYYERYIGVDMRDGDVTGDPNAGITMAFCAEDNEFYLMPDTWNWGNPVRSPDMS